MKSKVLMVLIVAIGMAIAAEGQSLSVGPRVGASFTTFRALGGNDSYRESFNDEYDYAIGAQFGAVFNFSVSKIVSIQPEILYSQKGYETHQPSVAGDPTGDISSKLRMNYLEVPVMARISFGGENFKSFVTAGPSAGYWMNGKSWFSFAGREEEKSYEFQDRYVDSMKDNRLDISANVGVGVAYNVGAGALNLDIRYGFGLSGISKYENDRPSDEPKVGHRTFGVSLAYLFLVK
ncbi:porin family protein [Pontibacter toksunensis]|uniref:Porin family protein n=1 Tax=Pontibacter toksunensis TaxID=1332631 RepID=A0ABW6BRI5_9BACT